MPVLTNSRVSDSEIVVYSDLRQNWHRVYRIRHKAPSAIFPFVGFPYTGKACRITGGIAYFSRCIFIRPAIICRSWKRKFNSSLMRKPWRKSSRIKHLSRASVVLFLAALIKLQTSVRVRNLRLDTEKPSVVECNHTWLLLSKINAIFFKLVKYPLG